MKRKISYTYTMLRYVHDIATGEFMNAGVVLYAPEMKYLGARCRETYGRLSRAFPGVDGSTFKNLVSFIENAVERKALELRKGDLFEAAPKTAVEIARSVLPEDSSSLQWSPAGSGLTEEPERELTKLFDRMVLRYEQKEEGVRRTDDEVWDVFKRPLHERSVAANLQPKKFVTKDDEVEFKHAWKNGVWHCLSPVSLDLTTAEGIREKAHRWLGSLTSISELRNEMKVYLLIGEPRLEALQQEMEKAVSILGKIPIEKELIREPEAEKFSKEFANEMRKYLAN